MLEVKLLAIPVSSFLFTTLLKVDCLYIPQNLLDRDLNNLYHLHSGVHVEHSVEHLLWYF